MTPSRLSSCGPVFPMVRGHHILAGALGPGSRVLDLGANRGAFSQELTDRFGCQTSLVEANPALYDILKSADAFPVKHCAVTAVSGSVTFNVAKNDEGSSVLNLPTTSVHGCVHDSSVTVPALTLEEVYEAFGIQSLDLLKMDIEGAEVDVLASCTENVLRRTTQITVEFHCDPSFGFGSRDRAVDAMARLRSLGFTQYTFADDFTDVLFVNHAMLGTSAIARAFLWLRTTRTAWVTGLWRLLPTALRVHVRERFGTTKE